MNICELCNKKFEGMSKLQLYCKKCHKKNREEKNEIKN